MMVNVRKGKGMRVSRKKWMSKVLAVLMAVSMFPINANAELGAQDLGANPEYTVQYYAEVEELVTKTKKTSNNDLAIIDTAKNSKLPTNASIDEMYITLDKNGKPIKETVVEAIFESKDYKFFDAPNLAYVDLVSPATSAESSLAGNGSYDLVEVWVLKEGKNPNSSKESDFDIYTNPEAVVFTNDSDATGTNVVNITDDTVVRLVYDKVEQATTYSNAVQMFDYDITDGKVYTSNGKRYVKAAEYGINSNGNYPSGSEIRYAFGNANMGTKHGLDEYNDEYINRAASNSSSDTNIKTCHFGIVGNNLVNGLPAFNMAAPDIFSMNAVTGKHIVDGNWSLGFIQDGDSYTLSTVNNGSKNVLTNLEALRKAGNYDHIRSNFFWPLDGAYTTVDGKTYKPGNGFDAQLGDSNLYKWDGDKVSDKPVPSSDEATTKDILHNCYFGMSFEVEFTIEEGYIGPLEYLFFGDDDMWVYLDGKLICDIGGVHSSVGEYVDLWDYLSEETAEGKHTLDFFYAERGASGSSCYMYFTLPSVTVREQTSYNNLGISKEVTGVETDEKFDFTVELDGIGEEVKNIYPYVITNAEGEEIETGYVVDGTVNVKMANGDSISIPYLPVGATYTVTETENDKFVASVNGVDGNVAEGTIQPGTPSDLTFNNDYNLGNLVVSKVLAGTDASTTDEFAFRVTLDDTSVNGTFGDMTFENGVAEFTLTGGTSAEATDLLAGIGYTVEETDGLNYHMTSTGATGTIEAQETVEAVFTNSRSYTELTVNKVWEGYEGRIPASIEVQLYKDGKAFGEAVELTAEEGWTYTWTELDATCVWTADEVNVPADYDSSVVVDGTVVTITNVLKDGNLVVSKTITGTDASTEDEFTFKVTLSDTTINGEFGDMTFANGVAEFTLKGGESAVATGLPEGVEFVVEETDGLDYKLTASEGTTGAIVEDESAEASFTNQRSWTELTVNKVWEGYEGRIPASIEVQLYKDGEAYGEPVELTAEDEWTYTWEKLDADFEWSADEVEVPEGYVKVETVQEDKVVTITNALITGNLVVNKTISGEDAKETDEFTFTVTLNDETINGEFGDMTFVDGVAEFTLKGGESAEAAGLPAGVEYVVEETEALDYEATYENEAGEIVADETAEATVDNYRSVVSVTVNKVWEGKDTTPEYVEVQLYKDGEKYGDVVKLSAENKWTYTWEDLKDEFKWTVDEVKVPEGYEKTVKTEETENGVIVTITNTYIPKVVPTGDSSNPMLYLAGLLMSGAVLFEAIRRRRRV